MQIIKGKPEGNGIKLGVRRADKIEKAGRTPAFSQTKQTHKDCGL